MEKRFQSIDSMINVSVIVVLTPTEQEKLECVDLRHRIDTIAKDMHVDWAVETNGNVCVATISRMYGPVIGNMEIRDIENDATNFMSAINKLEFEKPLPAQDVQKNTDYDLIKKIVDEWDETETRVPTVGFAILAGVDIFGERVAIPCGHIKDKLAKELCMSYLKVHSND